jgi:hypothetical protein
MQAISRSDHKNLGLPFLANRLMVISSHNLQQIVYSSAAKDSKIIKASVIDGPCICQSISWSQTAQSHAAAIQIDKLSCCGITRLN